MIACADQDEVDHYWDRSARAATRRAAVRLAQGPLRRLVAGRPDAALRAAGRPGPGAGAPGDRGDAGDEEARHRRAGASRRGVGARARPRRAVARRARGPHCDASRVAIPAELVFGPRRCRRGPYGGRPPMGMDVRTQNDGFRLAKTRRRGLRGRYTSGAGMAQRWNGAPRPAWCPVGRARALRPTADRRAALPGHFARCAAGRDRHPGSAPVRVRAWVEQRIGQAGRPAARASWQALTPLPQATTTGSARRPAASSAPGRAAASASGPAAPSASNRARSSGGARKRPSVARNVAVGALIAVGMWPATGSIGSTSPRYRSGARASSSVTVPRRAASSSRAIVRGQAEGTSGQAAAGGKTARPR